MNKKKLITMLTALALVGAIGVGATLAWLSDTATTLTNTFAVAQEGIGVRLHEATIDGNNDPLETGDENTDRFFAGEEKDENGEIIPGQNYVNIIPGSELDKDPTVRINGGSLNCNVFVSVQNANDPLYLAIKEINPAWYDLTDVMQAKYGVEPLPYTRYYVYKGTNSEIVTDSLEVNDEFSVVKNSTTDVDLEDIFEKLTVGKSVTDATLFSNIEIKTAAVQADYCTDTEAATLALGLLNDMAE